MTDERSLYVIVIVRASESFLYFAQKEEDVPAYHRRYDFFIREAVRPYDIYIQYDDQIFNNVNMFWQPPFPPH